MTSAAERQTWTTGTLDEAFALIRPVAPDRLRIVQDGSDKRDYEPASNGVGLVG